MTRKSRPQPAAQPEVAEPAPETTPTEPSPEPIADPCAELLAQMEALRAEAADERGRALRAQADFQNFKRRSQEQQSDAVRYANQQVMLALLPVLDNLERAIAASAQSDGSEGLVSGVAMTLRQLQGVLAGAGVTAIEALGAPFDPSIHDAVMSVPTSDHPENTVVEELQTGYMIHDRVLRASMVKVSVAP